VSTPAQPLRSSLLTPDLLVILAGVTAALHVGKLPPALPLLREALGVTLLQAGFLLSLVQVGRHDAAGCWSGLAADGLGLRRSVLAGLVTLALASAAGWFCEHADRAAGVAGAGGVWLPAGLVAGAQPDPPAGARAAPEPPARPVGRLHAHRHRLRCWPGPG
jgi:MFS family permease